MKLIILTTVVLVPFLSFSQIDSAFVLRLKALDTANFLKADTASVPNDTFTQKIKQLLGEKKGLSVVAILKLRSTRNSKKIPFIQKNSIIN